MKNIIEDIKCLFLLNGNSQIFDNEAFKYTVNDNYVEIHLDFGKNIEFNELSFEIEFKESPISWRNHDYNWVDLNKTRISNELSPKILKFQDNNYLFSNRYFGVWKISPKNKRLLKWQIHHRDLSPFFYLRIKRTLFK